MRDVRRRHRAPLLVSLLASVLLAGAGGAEVKRPAGEGPSPTIDPSWSRVIVELAVPRATPGTLPDEARRAQIAAARDQLVASLDPAQVRVVRSYDTIPFVALAVSPAGEAALRASPLVRNVAPDRTSGVQ